MPTVSRRMPYAPRGMASRSYSGRARAPLASLTEWPAGWRRPGGSSARRSGSRAFRRTAISSCADPMNSRGGRPCARQQGRPAPPRSPRSFTSMPKKWCWRAGLQHLVSRGMWCPLPRSGKRPAAGRVPADLCGGRSPAPSREGAVPGVQRRQRRVVEGRHQARPLVVRSTVASWMTTSLPSRVRRTSSSITTAGSRAMAACMAARVDSAASPPPPRWAKIIGRASGIMVRRGWACAAHTATTGRPHQGGRVGPAGDGLGLSSCI